MVDSPTFTTIHTDHFTDTGKGADKELRHQEGKPLYTHSKSSSTGLKSFFGTKGAQKQIDNREQKVHAGASYIKQAIDREFGQGMGNRVFANILENTGKNLGEGVTRRDLGTIREAVDQIRVSETRIGHFSNHPTPQGVQQMRQIYLNGNLPEDVRQSARDAINDMIEDVRQNPNASGLEVLNYIKDFQSMSSEVRLAARNAFEEILGGLVDTLGELDLSSEGANKPIGLALSAVNNNSVPQEIRGQLATALREALTDATPQQMDNIFNEGSTTQTDAIYNLVSAKTPEGQPLFSEQKLTEMMEAQLTYQVPKENPDTFLRSTSVATTLMAAVLSGNETFAQLKAEFQGIIVSSHNEYELEGIDEYESLIPQKQEDSRDLLTQLDTFFREADVDDPGLQAIFQAIRDSVNSDVERHGFDASEFVKNTLVLRGFAGNEMIPQLTQNGIGSNDPGRHIVDLLQKSVGESNVFRQQNQGYMQPWLAEVRAQESGLNALVGRL